jgi:hypothetical protein
MLQPLLDGTQAPLNNRQVLSLEPTDPNHNLTTHRA